MTWSKVRLPAGKPLVRERVLANVHRFVDGSPDHDLELWMRRKPKERSLKQNAALFAVAYPPLRDHLGESIETIHELFCGMYFGWNESTLLGRKVSRPIRTTTTDAEGNRDVISTKDFAEFYEFIVQHAAQAGVFIADPNPFWKEEQRAA